MLFWFNEAFGYTDAVQVFFSPGRFNILGEHLDYNGGHVLPGAMELGTYIAAAARSDTLLNIRSRQMQDACMVDLTKPLPAEKGWWRYVAGAVVTICQQARKFQGLDLLLHSTLPIGAGLSSSASVTAGTAYATAYFLQLHPSCAELAVWSKRAENEFAGVPCGYLDPFAICCARRGYALLLNCSSLHYRYIPVHMHAYAFIIVDSGTRRTLAEAPFKQRAEECAHAKRMLRRLLPIEELADVTPHQFYSVAHWMVDEVAYRRARHVVGENARVLTAAESLNDATAHRLARLMHASHVSLRDYYEVSTPQLELLVAMTRTVPGCLATRISGAGFGGCVLSLIRRSAYAHFIDVVSEKYRKACGFDAAFYPADFSDGVRLLTAGE